MKQLSKHPVFVSVRNFSATCIFWDNDFIINITDTINLFVFLHCNVITSFSQVST